MKRYFAHLVFICFLLSLTTGCDTQKPATEVKGAQDRVEKKINDAREKQNAENPEAEEGSN